MTSSVYVHIDTYISGSIDRLAYAKCSGDALHQFSIELGAQLDDVNGLMQYLCRVDSYIYQAIVIGYQLHQCRLGDASREVVYHFLIEFTSTAIVLLASPSTASVLSRVVAIA